MWLPKETQVFQSGKLCSEESMTAAINSVLHDNMTSQEASRQIPLCNVPFETLRRQVNGSVKAGCRAGPGIMLTKEEDGHLALYLFQMADMGFGLSRDTVMGQTKANHSFSWTIVILQSGILPTWKQLMISLESLGLLWYIKLDFKAHASIQLQWNRH